jgi:ATP phosphoribosyltransferase regulatory subunit
VIERFLAVTGDPDEAADALRRLAADAGLDIDASLNLFESRTGFLAARGIEVARVKFSTAFGRGLDYYTGFVFEMHDAARRIDRPLVGGGRYDGLLTRLGASEPIPAVGFAVWIERLAEVGSAT